MEDEAKKALVQQTGEAYGTTQKFVTKEELEELGLASQLGTNSIKPWLHGFLGTLVP